ncbi:MAG: response regulator transcription factor [Nocardioides sp.]|nr:response regulator transcription factor [Nocardioides sp.]
MRDPDCPVNLAIISRQEVVARGLTAMLADYPKRVLVVALPSKFDVDGGVDVVLYDTLQLHRSDGADLRNLLAHGHVRVLVFARDMRPDLRARAIAMGAKQWISMSTRAAELVEAVELVADGRELPERPVMITDPVGLSPREEEIVALIAQGLSNQEIVDRLYMTINTLKSHVRAAYSKMGVTSRAQAVSWALQHGYAPGE